MFSEVESRETLFKSPTAQMSVNFVTLWSFVSDIYNIIFKLGTITCTNWFLQYSLNSDTQIL